MPSQGQFIAPRIVIEPHASITGLWYFGDERRLTTLADAFTSAYDLRAKVEGDTNFTRPNRVSLRATESYDGIGDGDFSAYSGKLWVNVPLN